MIKHFGFDTTMQWSGYMIKRTRECRGSEQNPMYCVSKGNCNPIPGAMFFSDPDQAVKAIAALRLSIMLIPAPGYEDDSNDARVARANQGDAYHMFMKLAL